MDYQIIRYKVEIKQIKDWFKSTDYYPNKIIRGEWNETTPKWVAYKLEAKQKALRLEELNELIKKER